MIFLLGALLSSSQLSIPLRRYPIYYQSGSHEEISGTDLKPKTNKQTKHLSLSDPSRIRQRHVETYERMRGLRARIDKAGL